MGCGAGCGCGPGPAEVGAVKRPLTDAQLVDYLQRRFGVGAGGDQEPYFRARIVQIGMVKRLRAARGLTIEELVVAAEFCHHQRRPVRSVAELAPWVVDAKRWARTRVVGAVAVGADPEVAEAMAVAAPAWRDRFARAVDQVGVLAEWRAAGEPRG